MRLDHLIWQTQTPIVRLTDFISEQAKVKKIALYVFSSASFFVGGTLALTSFSGTLLSLPFFGLTYLFFKVALRIKDYQDLSALKTFQKEAKDLSFSSLIQEHQGLDPIFIHEILSKKEIREKFQKEHLGKMLSSLLHEYPISYLLKYHLYNESEIREKFYAELMKSDQMSDFHSLFGDMILSELSRSDVISSKEYEDLISFQIQEEELDIAQRVHLLQLEAQYAGRRGFLLMNLEESLKKEKEILQKLLSQKNTASSLIVRGHQRQIKALEGEKMRIEKDPLLGSDLESKYKKAKIELQNNHLEGKKKLKEAFSFLKQSFSQSISTS